MVLSSARIMENLVLAAKGHEKTCSSARGKVSTERPHALYAKARDMFVTPFSLDWDNPDVMSGR